MKRVERWCGAAIAVAMLLIPAPAPAVQGCAARRMTAVGSFCVDRYEASVWRIPPTATDLVKAAQTGKPTAAELAAGGAIQLEAASDFPPCNLDGTGCEDVYAVSTSGTQPSGHVTWFQAQQACLNARKRLARNAEWQAAVTGTPDPGTDDQTADCASARPVGSPVDTGSRSACVSSFGNYDMVGNIDEWTADWTVASQSACPDWDTFSNDGMCFAGADPANLGPGVLLRGGFYLSQQSAGPLDVYAATEGSFQTGIIGFRCAR